MAEQEIEEILKSRLQEDLKKLFNNFDETKDFLDIYNKNLKFIFGPFLGDMSWIVDNWWIEQRWKHGEEFLEFHKAMIKDKDKAISPLSFKVRVLCGFKNTKDITKQKRLYFFSHRDNGNHWDVSSRAGYGVKDILTDDDIDNKKDALKEYLNNNLQEDISKLDIDKIEGEIQERKDKSVVAHMAYPQLLPVWYVTTRGGYSQIKGIMRILRNTVEVLKKRDKQLEKLALKIDDSAFYKKYKIYASAYRFILWGYHHYLENLKKNEENKKFDHLHWDYLTKLLADLDTRKDAITLLKRKKALILYGVPGTGKTYWAKKFANEICEKDSDKKEEDEANHKSISDQNFKILQLHPNYSYQDFVLGIRPESNSSNKNEISYPVKPGPLYRACCEAADAAAAAAANTPDPQKFVLILDEINRADLSKVFGELMYCLEYRGNEEGTVALPQLISEQEKIIPFFADLENREDQEINDPFERGHKFYFPENLYFIGTMNTVDRSLSGFDVALRRRFGWYRMNYDKFELSDIIEKRLSKEDNAHLDSDTSNETVPLSINTDQLSIFIERCNELNNTRIKELGLGTDHQIGHTYFSEIADILINDPLRSKENTDLEIQTRHLDALWLYHLQPLLEEYLGFEFDSDENNHEKLKEIQDFFCEPLTDKKE